MRDAPPRPDGTPVSAAVSVSASTTGPATGPATASTTAAAGEPARRGDRAGAAGSALAIGIGAAAFHAARDYSTLGAVFPRTVGALLVALGALHLLLFALGRTRAGAALQGSTARRAAVAAVMLGWGFALGPLGFLPSSAVAMALLVVVAQHGRWSPRTALVSGGAAALVLVGLYALFKHVLLVPLP